MPPKSVLSSSKILRLSWPKLREQLDAWGVSYGAGERELTLKDRLDRAINVDGKAPVSHNPSSSALAKRYVHFLAIVMFQTSFEPRLDLGRTSVECHVHNPFLISVLVCSGAAPAVESLPEALPASASVSEPFPVPPDPSSELSLSEQARALAALAEDFQTGLPASVQGGVEMSKTKCYHQSGPCCLLSTFQSQLCINYASLAAHRC